MVKRIGRRFVSLLLTFVTILTLLPAMTLPALAAPPTMPAALNSLTFHDLGTTGFPGAEDIKTSIGINNEKFDGEATISGTAITITATGTSSNKCNDKDATVTLTLTNSHATTATLTFTKDSSVKVNSVGESTVSGSNATIPFGGSIEVSVTSDADTKVSGTFTVTGLKFEVKTLTTTFLSGENGSYTIRTDAGEELTTGVEYTKPSTVRYRLEPKPDAGYAFDRWIDFDTKETLSTSSAYETSGGGRIAPVFAPIGCARYYIAGASKIEYSYLDEAIAAAGTSGTIVAASDGTVLGSKGQKTFTIPSGVTLLIPFDETGTLYTNKPEPVGTAEPQTAYKTLTMVSGSSITVEGAISVGGKHFAGSAGSCCKATGPYGQIIMQEGSSIVLNSGANLYAWGYITGDGEITATSGSTVYEYFQVADWRGGAAVSKLIGNSEKVFPFSQYYVQNIEAALTIREGAQEHAYFSVDAKVVGTQSVTIDFIGSSTSLFRLGDEGTLTKKYDPKTDRITYTTTGKASLDSLNLSVSNFNIDSQNYVLPVNSNMTLNILSGNVAVNCDAALLPGAQITIARGAKLSVSTDKSLYVYDRDQWKAPYVYNSKDGFMPIPYSPSKKGNRTLANAKIDVNGTLTAAGSIYTTNSGADICSSEGGGRFVQQNAPGSSTLTHQVSEQKNPLPGVANVYYDDIPITPAQLKNDNGSYIKTSDYHTGDTFTYCKCQDCGGKWVPNLMVAEFNAKQYGTLQEAANDAKGASYVRLLHSTTEKITAQNNLYLDLNGYTVTGDFDMAGHTLYGMDSSVKGYDDLPKGKIVGGVSGYAKEKIYQTAEDKPYDRYVAVLGKDADNKTPTLSFHRFNISVTGYRFELATGDTPQCALFFIGKFQGDTTAKDYLTSLGFTLTDIDGTTKNFSCAKSEFFSAGAEGETTVISEDGAYLFEAYLMRDIDKTDPATYQKQFGATAQATFNNNGTQSSEQQHWSFQDAWENPGEITEKQQKILTSFLAWLDTPQSNGVNEHDE